MTYQEIMERMEAGYIPVCILYEDEQETTEQPDGEEEQE